MSKKLLIVLSATVAMLASSMGTVSAQTTTECGAAPAGYNVIESNARYIIGTTGKDFICAGDSVNTIRAKGKDDIIYGGGGNDIIFGGFGNDQIWGGDGDDTIYAGGGADEVVAGDGDDTVLGGQGWDTVSGDEGNDVLTGGDGNDELNGNADNDRLNGNKGWDTLNGGEGNDIINGGKGDDTIDGGDGDDKVNGGEHDDTILGGDGDDQLRGSLGNDAIDGGPGADAVVGGDGNDELSGSDGDDTMIGGNGDDTVDGGEGTDAIIPTEGDNDNCVAPDDAQGCDLIDGEVPFSGALHLQIPGQYADDRVAGAYYLTGTGWESETVLVEWSSSGEEPIIYGVYPDGHFRIAHRFDDGPEALNPTVTNSSTEQSHTLERAIDSYETTEDDQQIRVIGTVGKIVQLELVGFSGEVFAVIDLELIESGAVASFAETSELVFGMNLSYTDDDGDIEFHNDVWRRPYLNVPATSTYVTFAEYRQGGSELSNLQWRSADETLLEEIESPRNWSRFEDIPKITDSISIEIDGTTKTLEVPAFTITSSSEGPVYTGTATPGATIFVDIEVFNLRSPNQIFSLVVEDPFSEEQTIIRNTTIVDDEGNWTISADERTDGTDYLGTVGVIDADGDRYYRNVGNSPN